MKIIVALAAGLLTACSAIDPYNMLGRRNTMQPTRVATVPVPEPSTPGLKAADRALAFDFVWSTIDQRYYDPKLHGADWRAVRERYRPLALSAPDDDAFWDLLDRMTGELRDAHTRVESPKRAVQIENSESISLGFSFIVLEEKLVVSGVNFESDAYWAGVRSGMRIVSIGGESADTAFEKLKARTRQDSTDRSRHLRAVRRLSGGDLDSTVAFTFERPDGTRFDATLKRRKLSTTASSGFRVLPSGYGYLRLTQWTFGATNRMIEGLAEIKATPGLIIDLRGNPGGSLQSVKSALSQFYPKRTELGRTLTRTGQPISFLFGTVEVISLKISVPGNPDAYTGPVVVLVNESSGSGSEYFAAALQATNRGTIMGQQTCGCLLGFLGYASVPGGAELAYSEIGFEMANGKRIEGEGVVPDKTIPVVLSDLQLNRDRALEEAQALLASKVAEAKAAVPAKP